RDITGKRWRDNAADVPAKILNAGYRADNPLLAHRLRQRPGVRRTNAEPAQRNRQQPNGRQFARNQSRRDNQATNREPYDDEPAAHTLLFATTPHQPIAQEP